MNARSGRGWTAADYDSQQVLLEAGCRDAAARVARARRAHPLRHTLRTLRPQPRSRRQVIDWDAARRAAAAVARGDFDEATRIADATTDPRATAVAACRVLDAA
ncbi:hypothetical protein [Streptomyces sp. DH12]|uniref:hypothetical protein n=1 Tax=Streptomyces sp. DH12 TaxID=2857010 RepID=UPI001E3DFDBC|nr:hypothetical protein [Streptomyces sp. DH12]